MPSNHQLVGQEFPEEFDLSNLPVDLQELADQLTCDANFLSEKLSDGQLHQTSSESLDKADKDKSANDSNVAASGISMALQQPEFDARKTQVEKHEKIFAQQRKAIRHRWWKVAGGMMVGVFVLGVGVQTARLIDRQIPAENSTAETTQLNPTSLEIPSLMAIGQSPENLNSVTTVDRNALKIDPIPKEINVCCDAAMEGWLDVKDETRVKAIKF